jgi:hypothetical protein
MRNYECYSKSNLWWDANKTNIEEISIKETALL